MVGNGFNPAEKGHMLVSGDKLVRTDQQLMIYDGVIGFTAEIEVRMMSEIERRGTVGNCFSLNQKSISSGRMRRLSKCGSHRQTLEVIGHERARSQVPSPRSG